MTDFCLTKEYWSPLRLIQDQMNQWQWETGQQPQKLTFTDKLFETICAHVLDRAFKEDLTPMKVIASVKIETANGTLVIERGNGTQDAKP